MRNLDLLDSFIRHSCRCFVPCTLCLVPCTLCLVPSLTILHRLLQAFGDRRRLNLMQKEKILVIGASGQIGVELTLALRKIYGAGIVVASDLREENELLKGTGPYVSLD